MGLRYNVMCFNVIDVRNNWNRFGMFFDHALYTIWKKQSLGQLLTMECNAAIITAYDMQTAEFRSVSHPPSEMKLEYKGRAKCLTCVTLPAI